MPPFLSNLLPGANPSTTSGKLELPVYEEEPLAATPLGPLSEKCELRIEGMTCGACVEVSHLCAPHFLLFIDLHPPLVHRGHA